MNNEVLDISVIICAYTEKRWDDLLAAVDSIKKQQVPPRETIIVVDHNQNLRERLQVALPVESYWRVSRERLLYIRCLKRPVCSLLWA